MDGAGCAETAEAINRDGGTAVSYEADVTDRHRIAAVHAAVTSALGPVDILVNNAGLVSAHMYVNPESERLVRDLVNVNLLGQIWVSQILYPGVPSVKPGRVTDGPRVFMDNVSIQKLIISLRILYISYNA